MLCCGDMRRVLPVILAVAAGFGAVLAQINIDAIGPQVGQRAIDFRLVDQAGRTRTLAGIAGRNGTMLVFFRSADW